MKAGDKILVAPLDWGLGHASRCVPIINFLLEQKLEVIIGGSGSSLEFLKQRFPSLTFVEFPSAKLTYGKKGMVSLPFFLSMCKFASNVRKEHSALEKIVREYAIDYVFSDNRLGLYTKSATTYYMTHQFNFDNGFLNRFSASVMKKLHRHYINKYDFCCVPDVAGKQSLSGILSETDLKVIHLGPLSRFNEQFGPCAIATSTYFDLLRLCSPQVAQDKSPSELGERCGRSAPVSGEADLLILSGIEPQRSILEKIFIDKYSAMPDRRLIIVRGIVGSEAGLVVPPNVSYENNPDDSIIANLILSADMIFCRSGYSTLCDLAALKRRAVLIPTPRQPEQEYLAMRFSREFDFPAFQQKQLADIVFSEIIYKHEWDCENTCNLNILLEN